MAVIAGGVPYGAGGFGQHLAQVVEQVRGEGRLSRYYATAAPPGDPLAVTIQMPLLSWLRHYTPVRFSPSWQAALGSELFDRAVAGQLTPDDEIVCFGGQALNSFKCARRLRYHRLILESATPHILHVRRQHTEAARHYSIENAWLGEAQCRKTLLEYECADCIVVASEHSRLTFMEHGIPPAILARRFLHPAARFGVPTTRPQDGIFRVVYVGALTVTKGIPLLLDAFARIADPRAELTLVGGWATRGMRRYLQERLRGDPRVRIAPGDPLPHLQRATVYVHPSYSDGLGLAPLEALACGVPVIVTEGTGMKEYVVEGQNGYVVPTGSWESILERLEHVYHQRPALVAR